MIDPFVLFGEVWLVWTQATLNSSPFWPAGEMHSNHVSRMHSQPLSCLQAKGKSKRALNLSVKWAYNTTFWGLFYFYFFQICLWHELICLKKWNHWSCNKNTNNYRNRTNLEFKTWEWKAWTLKSTLIKTIGNTLQ